MKLNKLLGLSASLLLLAASAGAAVPYFGTDLGTPTLKGSFTDNGDGTLTIIGGGNDIWGNSDNGYYYYTWATGQKWDAKVQVIGLTGPEAWTKCEFMVRQADLVNGPRGDDAFMATMVSLSSGLGFQGRPQRAAGAINPGTGGTRTDPEWLRIIRDGATFTIMVSIDDQATWITNRVVDTSAGNDGFSTWPDAITIGVAVTAHNDADTAGGAGLVSEITGNFGSIVSPTTIGATVQPQSQTVFAQSEASFSYVTTNNVIPSISIVGYQWYKNGTAVEGATSTIFTILASQADNGAQIKCIATVNPPFNTIISGLTSDTATLTVNASTEYSGLKSEFFRNATRTGVESGSVSKATWMSRLPGLDDPGGYGDNYVNRVSGWWTPSVGGSYVFYVAADDDTDVYLSTDATPAHKQLIAQELSWNGTRAWTNDPPNRSSMTFTNGDGTTPWASGIPLAAGTKYYIEAVHHNGSGGDNLGVTYRLTTETEWTDWTTNGAPSRLTNGLSFYTWPATTLGWAVQPTNTGIYDLSGVTFRCSATNDSELVPAYQWYRNGQVIPNATGSSYTINPVVFANNNNDKFFVTADNQVGGLSITSQVATLTVLQTVFEPGFAKVEFYAGVTDRMRVENGTAGDPTFITTIPMLGAGTTASWGANYTRRLSAYFIPPTTGAYDFFIASDDDGDFFLSTDSQPANKRIIANETGWSAVGQWLTNAAIGSGTGGSVWSQKRSDTYTNAASLDLPVNPNGIQLTGGTRYYTEIVMHQGGGGDNVEGYWKLHSSPDPVNGAADNFVGAVIGAPVPRCSYVAFTNQPASQSVAVLTKATFTANGVTDSTMPIGGNGAPVTNNFMFFQWYKNDVAVAGANGPAFSIDPVLPGDNGAQIMCKMRALGYQDNAGVQLWTNSTMATLTVNPYVWEPGYTKAEFWQGGTRAGVENGTAGTPTWTTYLEQWDQGADLADNYARRFSGFFVPATTISWAFFVNADDTADLFLSTDDTPAKKRLIAQETNYGSGLLRWDASNGSQTQRASQTWSPDSGTTSPFAAGIPLTANNKYYIEAVHQEGGGGDYLQVLATNIDNVYEVVSQSPVNLLGSVIGTYVPKCSYMVFTQQPASLSVVNLGSASFTVAGDTDSQASISPKGQPTPNNKVFYQWYKNNTAIAGATSPKLYLPEVPLSDNGAQIVCKIRALGYGDAAGNATWSNSAAATINVVSTAPTAYAATFTDINVTPNVKYIDVAFTKRMDLTTLVAGNFQVTGGLTVTGMTVQPSGKGVKLTVTGTPTGAVTVTVTGVKDADGIAIAAGTVVTANQVALTCKDIGTAPVEPALVGDPAYPTLEWVDGANAYTIIAQGSDIWGQADGFNFLYEQKAGDFDVVVRQKSISHTSHWAKGGLMVRESLDADSRNWNIVNTPLASDGIMAADNGGYGASTVDSNARNTTGGDTASWSSANGRPDYPNAWLRLKRVGTVLTAYASSDGRTWTLLATQDPKTVGAMTALPVTVYVGISTTAHNNDLEGATEFLYYNQCEYADYNSAYIPVAAAATLTATTSGGNLVISWTPAAGHLQSTTALGGTWTDAGTANPATIPMTGPAKFFRVVNP